MKGKGRFSEFSMPYILTIDTDTFFIVCEYEHPSSSTFALQSQNSSSAPNSEHKKKNSPPGKPLI